MFKEKINAILSKKTYKSFAMSVAATLLFFIVYMVILNHSITEAGFKNKVIEYNNELTDYLNYLYENNKTILTPYTLNATLYKQKSKIIPSFTYDTEMASKFQIQCSELVYVGANPVEAEWIEEMGLKIKSSLEYNVSYIPINEPDHVDLTLDENSTFNGSQPSYDNPIIPSRFAPVNTPNANWYNYKSDWNKGLVIQDRYGNQFVWVPIDGKNVTFGKAYNTNIKYSDTQDDNEYTWFDENKIIYQYKGFYVARYEAMFDYNNSAIRVASKKSINKTLIDWSRNITPSNNGYLWNYVTYDDAKKYSEKMAMSYDYIATKVSTNLITGAEWDTIMKWLDSTDINVLTDSRSWGNVKDSVSPANVEGYGSLRVSGYKSCWIANNIYDLSGNTWEWTSEKSANYYIARGNSYYNSGTQYPAAYRKEFYGNDKYESLSFRVCLFVK